MASSVNSAVSVPLRRASRRPSGENSMGGRCTPGELPRPAIEQHEQRGQRGEGGGPAGQRADRAHHAELVEAAEAGHHQRGVGGRGCDRRHQRSAPDTRHRRAERRFGILAARAVLLVARHEDDGVVDAVADDDRPQERGRLGQVAEGQLGHGEGDGGADDGGDSGERNRAQPAEVEPDREDHDHHADGGDQHDVVDDRLAVGDPGGDGPRHPGRHLGVVAGRGIVLDQLVGGVEQRLARMLDEQAARGERGDPDVLAVVAAEDAAREALVEAVVVLDAALHLVDRLLFVERHEERVLALADLVAQAIADRFEVVLRHEQPLVLLVEGAQIADVVGRQVDHRGGQRPQLLGQRLGVAQVRRVVRRPHADEQQRHVPHPLFACGSASPRRDRCWGAARRTPS